MANQLARRLRKEMTDAERRLWPHLKTIDIPHTHFRRQVPIGPYVADFVCHAARLIIELDGGQHAEDNNIEYDAERTTFLESRGYKVLRFWNVDVFKSKDAVLETIVEELRARMTDGSTQEPPPGAASRADLPARGR
jgi:very-short-patch-repair endonuclease